MVQDLSSRCSVENGLSKRLFLQLFPLPGLLGGEALSELTFPLFVVVIVIVIMWRC